MKRPFLTTATLHPTASKGILPIVFAIAMLTISCGSANYGTGKVVSSPRYRAGSPDDGLTTSSFSRSENRIVIYNASLRIQVINTDSINSDLVRLSKKYGGYAVTLGNFQSIIRVESKYFNQAIAELQTHGKIKSKRVSGNDVTEDYEDLEVRLDNANKARQRYLQLLEKAENVDAALKVEKELERLNGDIDVLKGKIERLKHLSEFSTIEIAIEQKHKIGIIGYVGVGVYKAIKWLIIRD